MIDHDAAWEISTDLERITELLRTGIFTPERMRDVFVRSAIIELIVCLRDLLAKCERHASRIDFRDDVIQSDGVRDVTDLVTYIRDASCHPDSWKRKHLGTNMSFNIAYDKGWLIKIGDQPPIGNDYADDVAFNFGAQRIYLNRHIRRATAEAINLLAPHMPEYFLLPPSSRI